jgi:crossover junction endodeoxyribonuclease RuvC
MSRTSTPTSRSTTTRSKAASPDSPEAASPRILGVDPGSLVTGWGLIGGFPSRPEWIDAGVIRLASPSGGGLAHRLNRLQGELTALVERLKPTCAAVESPYHGVNPRSSFQLAQARGVVLAVLAGAGVEITEYTPATVKKSVTGNGRAPKEQVRTMVAHLLGPQARSGSDDLTDALALAVCHAGCSRHRALVREARTRPPRPHRA